MKSYLSNDRTDCSTGRIKPARSLYVSQYGFTLIELLVVVVIAAILMGLVMSALAGAQQDAYVAKTRATIRKIDTIIQERYEEYQYATFESIVGPAGSLPAGYTASNLPTQPTFTPIFTETDAKIHPRIRLQMIRDLMCFEMPDCPGDIIVNTSGTFTFRTSPALPAYYSGLTISLSDSANYSQLRSKIISRAINLSAPGTAVYDSANAKFNDITFLNRNFNAELLFLIVEGSYIGGSYSIETFANSEIGDTDGDGLREFLDAWGKPIQWLRWPAGTSEDPQVSQTGGSLKANSTVGFIFRFHPDPSGTYWNTAGFSTSIDATDPLDPNHTDLGYLTGTPGDVPRGVLRPLVVSAGSDGQFGLRFLWTGKNYNLPLFSLSDAVATISGTTYQWPDPYFPRPYSTSFDQTKNQSLGGVQNVDIDGDDPNPNSVLNVALGVQTGGFFFDPDFKYDGGSASATNQLIRESVSDNVSNLDETGGSL